ncbi:type I 3-dehydroquinate dehydratase [Gluconacetobacter diazotrophicus]|uniref:type I 3-dehydroquinate dehydratase n=1 Tax=Gluconacetobacter diazotrophicus TaxID=33996 RepID=UPI000173CD3C|nr:type I 3-dehydroquinate dehydratase [Gluconacetobacter diazotrophicus]TWB09727.1 3-dehydroquinate dehydratase [Gluconacetobacter diazotrophicus]
MRSAKDHAPDEPEPLAPGPKLRAVPVRGVTLGVGRAAVIVPIVAAGADEVRAAARRLAGHDAVDLVEARADHWHDARPGHDGHGARVTALCRDLRAILDRRGLIVTFRTGAEGGATPIDDEAYVAFYDHVLEADLLPDLIDVEFNRGRDVVRRIVAAARAAGVRVILSSHDFAGTGPSHRLVERMRRMQECDVDVLKLAVMPHDAGDVLSLLAATYEMRTRWADRPLITMAMGGSGVVSRLAGEIFGSAATFGMLDHPSAPGQIDARDLRHCVEIVHHAVAPGLRTAGTGR